MERVSSSPAQPFEASRRRTPRVIVSRRVGVEIPAAEIEAELVNLSFGGFCIDTSVSLSVGEAYLFRFLLEDGRAVAIDGRVVHCRRKLTSGRQPEGYLTGCEFIHDPHRSTEALIAALLDAATAELTFQNAAD